MALSVQFGLCIKMGDLLMRECGSKCVNSAVPLSTTVACLKKLPEKLKTRKKSSQEWLIRHINDPYVKRAKVENYRARSAFKLIEIDDEFQIFRPGQLVVDCGAAPGAWTQVATSRVNARNIEPELKVGKVIAVDLGYIAPIEGAVVFCNSDFTLSDVQRLIADHFAEKKPDVILSDMAPNASGVNVVDNENIILLSMTALSFAVTTLAVGGHFLCKIWDGRETKKLVTAIERFFEHTRCIKPASSRSESSELFILGRSFKGTYK